MDDYWYNGFPGQLKPVSGFGFSPGDLQNRVVNGYGLSFNFTVYALVPGHIPVRVSVQMRMPQ